MLYRNNYPFVNPYPVGNSMTKRMKMRYVVTATRPNGRMIMGWDSEADWLSCAKLYENQGWTVTLSTYLVEF